MDLASMVVNDFDGFRTAVGPDKADSPLVIDADAVLASPATFQRFQPICRRRKQVPQFRRIVQHLQFACRHDLDIGESSDALTVIQRLRITAIE
jgi:hypothetical protein